MEGYSSTILAYGESNSGKTFTMTGEPDFADLCGIIPNTFSHVFGYIGEAPPEKTFLVRCSYIEIFNEEIKDLLTTGGQTLELK